MVAFISRPGVTVGHTKVCARNFDPESQPLCEAHIVRKLTHTDSESTWYSGWKQKHSLNPVNRRSGPKSWFLFGPSPTLCWKNAGANPDSFSNSLGLWVRLKRGNFGETEGRLSGASFGPVVLMIHDAGGLCGLAPLWPSLKKLRCYRSFRPPSLGASVLNLAIYV